LYACCKTQRKGFFCSELVGFLLHKIGYLHISITSPQILYYELLKQDSVADMQYLNSRWNGIYVESTNRIESDDGGDDNDESKKRLLSSDAPKRQMMPTNSKKKLLRI
jgi:hypothetical protein